MEYLTSKHERRGHIIDRWPAIRKWSEERIEAHLPAVIAIPETIEEVQEAVRYARDNQISVIPYGGASGVLGGIVPECPSLTIDMRRLSGVIEFDRDNHLVTAHAGMLGLDLENYLNERGYTTGHYPQSLDLATLGGLVATKSAGTFSSRYGNIENILQRVEVVLPNGEIFENRNVPRSATGPHIPSLFIGSEGSFGVITKVTLKVWKLPERREFRGLEFDSFEDAVLTAREFYRRDIVPAVVRIYNRTEAQNLYQTIDHRSDKILMIVGIVGAETVVPEIMRQVILTAQRRGGFDIGSEIGCRWEQARFNASWLDEGNDSDTEIADAIEVASNWTTLPIMFNLVTARLTGICDQLWAHCSHLYPSGGNIYFIIFAKGRDRSATLSRYERIWKIIMESVHETGGSIAHHHGIGRQRLPWFEEEIGFVSMTILRQIKQDFDPEGLFSPGIFGL